MAVHPGWLRPVSCGSGRLFLASARVRKFRPPGGLAIRRMTHSTCDVALFGSVFLDHILTGFTQWPQPGHEAFATGYHREAGGGCFNTACGLAKLGCSATCFASVGEADGDWLVKRVREFGVITDEIRFSEQPSGVSVSVSLPKDRSFFTYNGANTDLAAWLEEPSLIDRLARTRHVHFACALPPNPGLRIVRALQARGCTVSLDVGWDPPWFRKGGSLEVLRQVDLFLPNQAEAEAITGQTSLPQIIAAIERIGTRVVA